MRTSLRALRPCFTSRPQWLGHGAIPVRLRRSYASVSAADLRFGQPVHETHPHILAAGEREYDFPVEFSRLLGNLDLVTPGITALEYAHRRSELASKLPDRGIAVIAASDIKYRSGAVFYDFHQDSNFFYLTGMIVGTQLFP